MKQALIALAGLSAVAAAHAQSNVTIYGRVDQSIRQSADAVDRKEVANGSGSRLGFRGTEDLGNGLKALFQIEHRFDADTGAQTNANANAFWHGKSIVGIDSAYGRITLGREDNAAYQLSHAVADPWATDTVANIAGTITRPSGVSNQRYNNAINYMGTFGGFSLGGQFAASEGATADLPYSLGAAYKGGPLVLGLGYENPGNANDNWLTVNGSYAFGDLRLGAFFGQGHLTNDQKIQSWLVSAVYKLGAGELRAAYGQRKNKDVTVNPYLAKRAALGYHHALSKRTTLYTDLAHENRDNIPSNFKKVGWDVGIKHNF